MKIDKQILIKNSDKSVHILTHAREKLFLKISKESGRKRIVKSLLTTKIYKHWHQHEQILSTFETFKIQRL